MAKRKCPKCGSTDVSRNTKNLLGNIAKETLGTTVEIAIDVPLMMVKNAILPKGSSVSYAAGARTRELGKKAHKHIVGDIQTRKYKCNACGHVFEEHDFSF